jgi:glutathione synthase
MRSLAFILDPLDRLNIRKDSSLAIARAAQARGWSLSAIQQETLMADGRQVSGIAQPFSCDSEGRPLAGQKAPHRCSLTAFDAVLMRKDPPFDMRYIYSTYLLERAEALGARVFNSPASIRDCNEKLFILQFPQCLTDTVVTADPAALRDFHKEFGDIIIKPLDGMGGSSIFRVRPDDPNLSVILETLTDTGRTPVMAQRFLPQIREGDKRILMINGEPVDHCLARIPKSGETRGNLAAGGRGVVQPLGDRDRWIASQVGPELKRRGLLLVGLDVIGDCLTEINVTSPTCLVEISQATERPVADLFLDALEEQMS